MDRLVYLVINRSLDSSVGLIGVEVYRHLYHKITRALARFTDCLPVIFKHF